MASLHGRGLVHGSLRPAVVLRFSTANLARLADLSYLAHRGGPNASLHPEPKYAAPEVDCPTVFSKEQCNSNYDEENLKNFKTRPRRSCVGL